MKKIIIWMMLIVIMDIPIGFAEIAISGSSNLDDDDAIYSKYTYLNFPSEDRLFSKNLFLTVELGCESISSFNSANPSYSVRNVSLRTIYTKKIPQNNSFEIIFKDYGCAFDTPTCDVTNTPITTGTTENFFQQIACALGFATCPVALASIRAIPFELQDGEHLSLALVTYFNGSLIIDDSPCTYGESFDSQNCRGCDGKTFEETINLLEERKETFTKKNSVFGFIDNVVDLNFDIWIIISYIIKIGVFIFAIFGTIYSVFWIFFFIRNEFGKG